MNALFDFAENNKIKDTILKDEDQEEPFLIKITKNNGNTVKAVMGNDKFSEEDLLKIQEWIHNVPHKFFKDDLYKIDVNEKILLFKEFEDELSIVLMGHILKYSFNNRLALLELRQQHLREIIG